MLALIQIILIGWIGYQTIPQGKEEVKDEKVKAKNIEVKVKRDFLETKQGECETKYTVTYKTKTSGLITVCEGALLKDGEKTKFITKKEK